MPYIIALEGCSSMEHCWAAELTFKKNLPVSVVQVLVALAEDLASIGSLSTL